jgi:D-aspartate ligase
LAAELTVGSRCAHGPAPLDTSTPALVLGCFRHGPLAILRSLGRLGVKVYALHDDPRTPSFFSRYCSGKFQWDVRRARGEDSVNFLLEAGQKIGRRCVLIPTSDAWAMLVADHAQRLAPHFIFPQQDPALIRALCSKKEMYYLAKKHNVPVPESAFPQCRQDVLEYLDNAHFPILLKPIFRRPSEEGSSRMVLVHSRAELLETYDAIENPARPNLVLQEYIPGGDEMTWTFNGYFDHDGKCAVAFTGRKLRNFPPYLGAGCLGVCVRNDKVQEQTLHFMQSVGYKGALDIGFRYDSRDGRYKVNDVNPRVGAMFRLFVGENGMDVVRAMYQDITGQPVTPSCTVEGRRWIVEDVDLVSALRAYRDGKMTLADWIKSYRGIRETSYYARDDLWPVAGVCMIDANSVIRRAKSVLRKH